MSYKVYYYNKPIGITPTECCRLLKSELKLTDSQKIGFACRLDPLAYGIMPVIIHDKDVKRIQRVYDSFNGLDKTYTFKVVMGYGSDTYDILGIPFLRSTGDYTITSDKLLDILKIEEDTYPPYSSKTIMDKATGKSTALWQLSREGRKLVLPTRKMKVYDIKILKSKYVDCKDVFGIIEKRLTSVSKDQDLRQDIALECWKHLLGSSRSENINMVKLEARVSSGTYIRNIGNKLGGVCYDICRISIGERIVDEKINKFTLSYNY